MQSDTSLLKSSDEIVISTIFHDVLCFASCIASLCKLLLTEKDTDLLTCKAEDEDVGLSEITKHFICK